jgi:hypothetical protein
MVAELAELAIAALNAYPKDAEMCTKASIFLVNGLSAGFADEIAKLGA